MQIVNSLLAAVKVEKEFTVLDLFCGAGGFAEGFRQAGFRIVAGVDNDEEALSTFSSNFPDAKAISMDLSDAPTRLVTLISKIPVQNTDILIGGPPCQGFSIAGKRLRSDPRNVLYRAFIELVGTYKPLGIVLENVPTILSLHNGETANSIVRDLNHFGYHTSFFILNAADYGVPQNRRRAFFIGLRDGGKYIIPKPTTTFNPITTEMAISDLPILDGGLGGEELQYAQRPANDYQLEMRSGSTAIYNHWVVQHKQETIDIVTLVPDGGNYKDLPEHLRDTRKVHIAWTRMNSKRPCFTIDAGHNHHFHYKANRVPTVRECARIQSFPDRFRFLGKKTSQFRQVGNAVPPLLAKAIALELKASLQ